MASTSNNNNNNVLPPAPNGQVLSLVSALSNTENHDLHVQAIRARDDALSSSLDSYSNLCLQLCYLLVGSDQPQQLINRISIHDIEIWKQTDLLTMTKIQNDTNLWIPFGQMAGLIVKNALTHPPITTNVPHIPMSLPTISLSPDGTPSITDIIKETLLYGLTLQHIELRNVVSSIIATCSVSIDSVQPALHIRQWPQLMPTLIQQLSTTNNIYMQQGALSAIRKMMEDGPKEIPIDQLDLLIPILLQFLQPPQPSSSSPDPVTQSMIVASLQSLVACLANGLIPSALVLQFADYLNSLSTLATHPISNNTIKKWVCRSINTLLEFHTMYLQSHIPSICQFMLQSTSLTTTNDNHEVAIEACEFWLTFSHLDEGSSLTSDMMDTVERLLPQLIPILLNNMVYLPEQRLELQARNELDLEASVTSNNMKPVFYRSRNKQQVSGEGKADDDDDDGMDDDDDDDDDDDEDGNEWTLRKYAGASLDSLANLYGSGPILPSLLPALQQGMTNPDQWVQEASILALGAIAEGCRDEMNIHLGQLYPHLMNILSQPETPDHLPQLKSITAWTVGRYVTWAIEQVQTGVQGHLLAHMTEVFLQRLVNDKNRRVQVACGSAFGVVMETAGDLMIPYLDHVFQGLITAMSKYTGRSLIILFDTIGIMADYCGPAIGEGNLPQLYIPPMLQILDNILKHDPTDRTLLPLMESLASIALACGMNYQPYALETFDNAMCTIEQVQLLLATTTSTTDNTILIAEEDADPIVCATDLLDGLCEGLGANFVALVSSSTRYGQHFPTVVHALCKYEASGVRMSGLALLGDLARNAPSVIEPALPQLLQEAITNLDPIQPSVCNNAVWAIGEICVQCGENSTPLEPFAQSLMQQLIALLMGNGISSNNNNNGTNNNTSSRVTGIPGLAENAAACCGRLAKVNPNFVAPELSRCLLGWCDGMAKITDPIERRDAFLGFSKAVYANPQAIQQACTNVPDAISSILFAIISWHVPPRLDDHHGHDEGGGGRQDDSGNYYYGFQPFPPTETELRNVLAQLMRDMKTSVGDDQWKSVQLQLPVTVRKLLHEAYEL